MVLPDSLPFPQLRSSFGWIRGLLGPQDNDLGTQVLLCTSSPLKLLLLSFNGNFVFHSEGFCTCAVEATEHIRLSAAVFISI